MSFKDTMRHLKERLKGHEDKVDRGMDRGAERADRRTGGKYTEHIERGSQQAKDALLSPEEKRRQDRPGGDSPGA
ncbi:antitoxin [Streptomyces sp. LX-29]|uniref:antitoxin n=1 Tax=Streptomyces sp. LX-29 TaxID=2900152 RepID=UPI00240D2555|nr:antitoxin [Streptomyces sp. LX-29]WFB09797.1 antitoxin [Streptomyces sp. LX-29]